MNAPRNYLDKSLTESHTDDLIYLSKRSYKYLGHPLELKKSIIPKISLMH